MFNKNLFLIIIGLMSILLTEYVSFAQAPADKAVKKDTAKKEERRKEDIKFVGALSDRDPFSLPDVLMKIISASKLKPENTVSLPSINIQGLILNKKMPQVIINGDVKKVGDKIENFEIQEITRNGVVLFYKGKTHTINIKKSSN